MKTGYTIAIRNPKGCWQYRQNGLTARETKRKLGKVFGLPVRIVDSLPLGKSIISFDGGEFQVKLEKIG